MQSDAELTMARAVLREWERLRSQGAESGVVLLGDEAHPRMEVVDRRAMRAARLVVARAEAVLARERAGD